MAPGKPTWTGAGPDGGDGGHGGDVWLVASVNQASLPWASAITRTAGRPTGSTARGPRSTVARGKDITVPVPVGTVVRDSDGAVQCDLANDGDRFLIAQGGEGGRGNARFLSNRRRAPGASPSRVRRDRRRWLDIELKLMADVALVGFPNAGKSTLISTVSAAKPKIADYPFTTLVPHLGVVRVGGTRDGTEFVMADIPGLVEGAAEGKGLGHRFLRHIERARVLVVLLDLHDPIAVHRPDEQLRILLGELGDYQPELLERPRVVVGSKDDLRAPGAARGVDAERGPCQMLLSSATGAGVQSLVQRLAAMVQEVRASVEVEATGAIVIHRPVPEGVEVQKVSPGVWRVLGAWPSGRSPAFSDVGPSTRR